MSHLVAKYDRDETWVNSGIVPPLTDAETELAVEENLITTFVDTFPRADRYFADPPYRDQNVYLFSFVPTKGARPDDQGYFGFMKFRGVFSTANDAHEYGEYLVKNVDSYNKIISGYVGRPFPIYGGTFFKQAYAVDVREDAQRAQTEMIRDQKLKDERQLKEIKEREAALLEECSPSFNEDPLESYTTERSKLAQLTFTYVEAAKKLEQVKSSILKTREYLDKVDFETPQYRVQFLDRFIQKRKSVGMQTDLDSTTEFTRYMGLDNRDREELGF